MGNYIKGLDKGRISFFVLMGLLVLFLILSFLSINNVYGFDSENITTNDIDFNHVDNYLVNNLNQDNNLVLDDNLDYNESIHDTRNITENSESSNDKVNVPTNISEGKWTITVGETSVKDSTLNYDLSLEYTDLNEIFYSDTYLNDNYKSNNVYLTEKDNLKKIGEKSTKLDNINKLNGTDFNNFYPIFQYPNSNNYIYYFNDINNYINKHIVVIISNSNFKGNGFENFNNFIKEIANVNFNKIDDEDTSFIQDFQSSPKPTLTILFFIKVFMKHHDHGKEHLNSF